MVTSVLTDPGVEEALSELLRPEPSATRAESEQRIVVCGISWDRYLAFDQRLGNDRSSPHVYYLEGELEIMTTSNEHERIKEYIGGLLEIYFEETRTEVIPRGQATIRRQLKEAGAEPDKSWCIGVEQDFPDLVLEIALTSGGVNKLEIYRRFQVSEVWFWRQNRLEIFALSSSGTYERTDSSRMLPGLNPALVERCATIQSWQLARQTFRAAIRRGASKRGRKPRKQKS